MVLWGSIVYFPVAHWVFSFDGFTSANAHGGWIANTLKAEDFAGGRVDRGERPVGRDEASVDEHAPVGGRRGVR